MWLHRIAEELDTRLDESSFQKFVKAGKNNFHKDLSHLSPKYLSFIIQIILNMCYRNG